MSEELKVATAEDVEAITAQEPGADPVAAAFERASSAPYVEAELVPDSPKAMEKPGPVGKIASWLEGDQDLEPVVFDVVRAAVCIRGPVPWDQDPRERLWSDADDSCLLEYLQTVHGYTGNRADLRDGFNVFSHRRLYDPLKSALDALPEWDGVGRVGHMMQRYLGVDQSAGSYGQEVERLLYDAMVRRVYAPGPDCKFDYMPVLIGPQGAGKSTFAMRLAVRDEFFTDNLPSFNDRDFPAVLQGRLVAEVSELASMSHSDIETVKGSISRTKDTYREPYAHHPLDRWRRCVFIGTTNRTRFLSDETGNRRFLPLECAVVEPSHDLFAEDVQSEFEQALAEAVASFKAGAARKDLVLSEGAQRAATEAQAEAYLEDPRVEQIGQWLENEAPRRVAVTQICKEALGITGRITRYDADAVRTIMDSHYSQEWIYSGGKKARIANYGSSRYYERREL